MEENWKLIEDDLLDDDSVIEEKIEKETSASSDEPTKKSLFSDNEDEDHEDEDNEDEKELNPFKIMAEELGFQFEGEDPEEFKAAFKEQSKKEFLEEYNMDDPQVANIIGFLSEGGNIKDYIELINQIPSINKMSPEQIYTAYLKDTTDFSDLKIKKLVKQAIDADEIEDEANTAREYFTDVENESVKELQARQVELKTMKETAAKDELVQKRSIIASKQVLGNPIENGKDFEKYFLDKTVVYKHSDGKSYKLTPYEKHLITIQSDPKQRLEYETMIAYMNFKGFKTPEDTKTKTINDLKSKLRASYSKGNRSLLIDEQ